MQSIEKIVRRHEGYISMISIRVHTYSVQKSHCLTESVKISTICARYLDY